MTRQSQKNEELLFAEKAGVLLGENWIIEQSPNEKDWPDLLISGTNGKFGLEVRNIFKDEAKSGSSLRKLESIRSTHLKMLSENYYKASNIPISLKVMGDIKEAEISAIVGILEEKAKSLKEQERLEFDLYESRVKFYIMRLPMSFGQYSRWLNTGDYVGWVSKFLIEKIEKSISIKETHLDKYRCNISDVRLLLVLNRSKNSGRAELPNNLSSLTSKFNNVYIMMYPEKIISINGALQ